MSKSFLGTMALLICGALERAGAAAGWLYSHSTFLRGACTAVPQLLLDIGDPRGPTQTARPGGHSAARPGPTLPPFLGSKAPFLVTRASPPVPGRAGEVAFSLLSLDTAWVSVGADPQATVLTDLLGHSGTSRASEEREGEAAPCHPPARWEMAGQAPWIQPGGA